MIWVYYLKGFNPDVDQMAKARVGRAVALRRKELRVITSGNLSGKGG